MKKIWSYVTDYFKNDCNYTYLILLMVGIAVAITINFGYISENEFIKHDPHTGWRLLKYVCLFGIVFGGAYALQILVDRKDARLRSNKLWLLIFFAVILFSFRTLWTQFQWVGQWVSPEYYILVYKLIINLIGFVFLCIPCFVYWWMVDRKREKFYGLSTKGVDLKPYFFLILLMVPLLLWAGTQPDFQAKYPRAHYLQLQPELPFYYLGTIIYEICYSLDYGVTEFFFRGFLILAFAKYVGPKAILPMCAFYVSIHFDKPLAECISSFFGGLLLGIIVYRTRSIYGGIIVHLGIALLMEVVGWMFV